MVTTLVSRSNNLDIRAPPSNRRIDTT